MSVRLNENPTIYISSFDIMGEDNSIFAGAVVMVMILNKSRLSLNEI